MDIMGNFLDRPNHSPQNPLDSKKKRRDAFSRIPAARVSRRHCVTCNRSLRKGVKSVYGGNVCADTAMTRCFIICGLAVPSVYSIKSVVC